MNKRSQISKGKKIYYDKKSDVLWLVLKKGLEEEYKEVVPGINVELDKNGELLGIEILNASKVIGKISTLPHSVRNVALQGVP